MRVMIVDDSRTMRMLVKRALRSAGVEAEVVGEAEDGRQALEALPRIRPQIVLSDWNMPEMTGLELLREVRRRKYPVRFGFVTSQATAEMWKEAHEAGADFLVAKPFSPDTIRQAFEGDGKAVHSLAWEESPIGRRFTLPIEREVADMWRQLLNRPVRVKRHPNAQISERNAAALALYRDRAGALVGVVAADLELCAAAGAVLSLFPPTAVKAAVRDGQLPEGIWDNLVEVFNVSSRFFHAASKDFVHLDAVLRAGEAPPREDRRAMRTARQRASYAVDIAGYGAGVMGLWGW